MSRAQVCGGSLPGARATARLAMSVDRASASNDASAAFDDAHASLTTTLANDGDHGAGSRANDATTSLPVSTDDSASPSTTQGTNEGAARTTSKKPKRKTYERVKMPTPEDIYAADAMDNCALKTVMSTVLGGALGAAMGIVFGAFEPMEIAAPDAPKVKIMDQVKAGARAAGARSWSYAKGFAAFGALYAGSECVVEKVRAKHDIANSAYAGCFTGGVMARAGGPSGMAIGCGTMAALSVAMDKFMDH
jgi:mitochondrial import inner membrane translocase subunit TIM22